MAAHPRSAKQPAGTPKRTSGPVRAAAAAWVLAGIILAALAAAAVAGQFPPAWAGGAGGATIAAGAIAWSLLVRRADAARLRQLRDGVKRIGQRNFSSPVPIDGKDLIAEVGASLNGTAYALGTQLATLQALLQIDRAILDERGIETVTDLATACVGRIADAEVAVVALVDPAEPLAMDFKVNTADDRTRIDRARHPVDPSWLPRLGDAANVAWDGEPPVPPAITEQIRACCGTHAVAVFRIGASPAPRGFIVLARRDGTLPRSDQAEWVESLAARIDTAAAAAQRARDDAAHAHRDALTGLPNRSALLSGLDGELAEAQRKRTRVGILVLDLDRFKPLNEALGQAAGDEMLKLVAERVRQTVREDDLVARCGGDEYAIVVAGLASGRDSGNAARDLIRALSRPFEIAGQSVYVGASVGISIFPDDGAQAEDLLKKADAAMYRAKEEGRSRFAYYEDSMNIETRRRVQLDRELRQALERNEFVLHYQPQFDVRSGNIAGVEALVRWEHPEHGLLKPAAFVDFADEIGLADAVGAWVLREACRQFERWRAAGIAIPRIAVNVSIEQLQRSSFVHAVNHALRAGGMRHDQLEIDVKESMFQRGGKAAQHAITSLAHAGVDFAIDDFGSGLASLAMLKSTHARVVKLDPGFTADAATHADTGMIVGAVVKMAHSLRKEVIAEGVERRDQLDFLRAVGCDRAQGYALCRPLPADELGRFVAQRMAPGSAPAPAPATETQQAVDLAPPEDEWLTVPFLGSDG
ncbi:MAG TPA: EAL domain-containing protein [Burkholderiaceae bacterium]|nr:EAL domain-containing protein [Burkholderiaceae bacterium]